MTMMEVRTPNECDEDKVFRLPDVGPEFASFGNPAYVQLINEFTWQYQAHNPDKSRSFISVAGAIDYVVSEALREGASVVPITAGRLALGSSV